ncbi:MAG: undecaprenyl-diphosphate phosphatase, partial [bacterium]
VSSSGHLILGKALLGINDKSILFEVVVHFGTLLAVVTAFSKDIQWLLKGVVSVFRPTKSDSTLQSDNDENAARYITFIIWATVPIVLVGLFLKSYVEEAFANPILAGYLLVVTGIILLISRLGLRASGRVNSFRSIVVGVVQAIAILPGISRSGSTIAAGMILGVAREEAARFSFLMAIPAIGGAFVLQLIDLSGISISQAYFFALATGFVVSYVSGFLAIKLLMATVKKGRFDYFAWYCFAVGFLAIYFLQDT